LRYADSVLNFLLLLTNHLWLLPLLLLPLLLLLLVW
jgi:hypothetical protein